MGLFPWPFLDSPSQGKGGREWVGVEGSWGAGRCPLSLHHRIWTPPRPCEQDRYICSVRPYLPGVCYHPHICNGLESSYRFLWRFRIILEVYVVVFLVFLRRGFEPCALRNRAAVFATKNIRYHQIGACHSENSNELDLKIRVLFQR